MGDSVKSAQLGSMEEGVLTLLPDIYQDRYDLVQPVSMGSAGLKYGQDGRVAWGEIWGSFCDLALAGGPPHKGTLLEPGSRQEIDADPARYREVVDEICRGVGLVTGLHAEASPAAGWVRMYCTSAAMAGWLARAIVVENVSASCRGLVLCLPAGPSYRVEKEIKNVITAVAKTCHFWTEHTPEEQRQAIADLFRRMDLGSPLIQPEIFGHGVRAVGGSTMGGRMAEAISQATWLMVSQDVYAGWLGLECNELRAAIWMMRMLVVCNVMARREGTVVFVPLAPGQDPEGVVVVEAVVRAHGYGVAKQIF
jgi:hypothetical protein